MGSGGASDSRETGSQQEIAEEYIFRWLWHGVYSDRKTTMQEWRGVYSDRLGDENGVKDGAEAKTESVNA